MNTSTSPKVQYSYANGSANHVRREKVTYPNGRVLHYGYDSGDDANLSRVSFLADDSSGSPGTHLAEYTYLGMGGIVQVDYTEPDLRYDLAHGSGDDPYDGMDRFDRVVDLLWRDYGASADAARIKHGYDRAGNRLWREDPVADANSVDLDELYTYDGLNQLKDMQRGDLNGTQDGLVASTKTFAEDWTLDPLGNWTTYKQDSDGDNTWDLDQDRSHNKANEITDIDSSSSHVAHDRAGNMTKTPKPDNWSAHFDLTYDPWHRLVKVEDGANTVAEYAYDPSNRRTLKKVYSGGSLDQTRHFYYTTNWQVLEERIDNATTPDRQFIWGQRYIDDLILRDRDADEDTQTGDLGKSGSGLEERLYAMQDPNWNVIAIADKAGDVQERHAYEAYGEANVHTPSFGSRASSNYEWEVRLAGYYQDASTGFHHIRSRYYTFAAGRFLSRDAIRYAAMEWNMYEYVDSDPLNTLDPSGLGPVRKSHTYESLGSTMASRVYSGSEGIVLASGAFEEVVTYRSHHFRNTPYAKGMKTKDILGAEAKWMIVIPFRCECSGRGGVQISGSFDTYRNVGMEKSADSFHGLVIPLPTRFPKTIMIGFSEKYDLRIAMSEFETEAYRDSVRRLCTRFSAKLTVYWYKPGLFTSTNSWDACYQVSRRASG